MFTPRLVIPNAGNPYYNTPDNGGYNPCIVGNIPQGATQRTGYPGLNVLKNCVSYATGRFNEIIGNGNCEYLGNRNAELFIALAKSQGLQIGTTPKLGACMVWQAGTISGKDGAGHVAIVEAVYSAKKIMTSESEWSGRVFRTKIRTLGSGRWGQSTSYTFLGFIYNPAVEFEICPYATPTSAFKKGATGESVRWLQWHLNYEGYNLKIDGSWGNDTQTAFNAWQMQTGLDIDGWCGALSRERLVALLPWNKGV